MSSLREELDIIETKVFNSLYPSSHVLSEYISILEESELSKGDISKVFKVAVAKRGDGTGAMSKMKDVRDSTAKGLNSLKSASSDLATRIKKLIDSGKITAEQAKKSLEKHLLATLDSSFGNDASGLDINSLSECIYTNILNNASKKMMDNGIPQVVVEHYFTISSVLLEGPVDRVVGKTKDVATKLGKKTGILDKGRVDISDLQSAWLAAGKPTDSEEIEEILSRAGFTSGEISRAFSASGVSRKEDHDANIVNLGSIVKSLELTPFVLKYLERFGIKESVKLDEKVVSDRDIRAMFVKLLSKEQPSSPDDHASSSSAIQKYVNKWASELKRLDNETEIPKGHEVELDGNVFQWMGAQWRNVTNKRMAKREVSRRLTDITLDKMNQPKVALVKEIVNFLADRHGTPQWKQVVKGVKRVIDSTNIDMEVQDEALRHIKDGTVMENSLYEMVDEFLCETGFEWESLGYSPISSENGMVSIRTSINKDLISEEFFSKVLESHIYGRRRK